MIAHHRRDIVCRLRHHAGVTGTGRGTGKVSEIRETKPDGCQSLSWSLLGDFGKDIRREKIPRWNGGDDVGVFGPAERQVDLNISSIQFLGWVGPWGISMTATSDTISIN